MKRLLSVLAVLALGFSLSKSQAGPVVSAQDTKAPTLTEVAEPGDTLKGEDRRIVTFDKEKRKVSLYIKYLDGRSRLEKFSISSGKLESAVEGEPSGISRQSVYNTEGTITKQTVTGRKRPTVIYVNMSALPTAVTIKAGWQIRVMAFKGTERPYASVSPLSLDANGNPTGRSQVLTFAIPPRDMLPPAGYIDQGGAVATGPGQARMMIYSGGQPQQFSVTIE